MPKQLDTTFEQFLSDAADAGSIDFAMRATRNADGKMQFYIHPAGTDGATRDFDVYGNSLVCTTVVAD